LKRFWCRIKPATVRTNTVKIRLTALNFQGSLSGMIKRTNEIEWIKELLRRYPVVGIIGARQVGKTTLARQFANQTEMQTHYFDLENPENLARLYDPMLALKELKGLVVVDEVQMMPDLFQVLRVLVDRPGKPCRFLILGSASPALLRQGSESLAGRIIYHQLDGFSLDEIDTRNFKSLWLRGGLPLSYLAVSNTESHKWRRAFIKTFLERDMPQLGITIRATTLNRFWNMLAHYHGQIWNASEFARSFGVADTTIRNYLDLLTSALVVKQLLPWHENISKRQVKAPKVYISDSGILHSLLNLIHLKDLEGHPKMGASWEGFVMHQLIRRLGAYPEECFFWATHAGAELDLLVIRGRNRLGYEIKRTSSPKISPSNRAALADLKLNRLDIIHAGQDTFPLDKKVRAVAFERILEDVMPL
jgi:predicted AAA+ superfamily ATPase